MTMSVTALYDDLSTAQRVVEELVSAGVERNNISLIANDASRKYESYINDGNVDDVTGGEGAGFGAVVGAMIGLGAMLIPGIGPVIAAGPLVAGLVGAGVGAAAGAVTGGIVASLVNLGVDEEVAGYYAEGVRRGGTLVTATTADSMQDRVMEIMNRHTPVDIKSRAEQWRSSGWTGFDENNTAYSMSEVERERATYPASQDTVRRQDVNFEQTGWTGNGSHTFDAYDTVFHSHYNANFANTGYDYSYYAPAYEYGYTLANDPRYRDYDWTRIESEARAGWEGRNEGPWDRIKDAVRNAWESVREAVR